MSTYVLINVDSHAQGSVEVESTDGTTHAEKCLVLTMNVLTESLENQTVALVIPKSSGPALLAHLLTDEQWEAVTNI